MANEDMGPTESTILEVLGITLDIIETGVDNNLERTAEPKSQVVLY